MNNRPAIAAAVEIRPGRYPACSNFDFYRQAIAKLLADYSLNPGDIDGIFAPPLEMTTLTPKIFTHEMLANELGITPRVSLTMNAGGATYGYMVQYAAMSIAMGKADAIICIGTGKFPKVDPETARVMMRQVCDPSFEYPYGPVIPGLYGQYATRYMHEYGVTSEDMAAVSVTARKWAQKHPDAITNGKGEISIQDVLDSRPIASPFHYLDCSIPCDGGGAVLVASETVARRIAGQPAYLLGMGEFHGHGNVSQNPDLTSCGAARSGSDAFRMSGLTPADIDHAQLYDAFSICPLMLLEDLGFAPRGHAAELFHSGRAAPGGNFPVNTYGGLIGFGHTGDASGMSMIVEGALQVMGRAGARQVKADCALVHCYGGMLAEHSTLILGRN
ncbi:MAG: thiolase family protein [Georgfuchsia sp.]